MNRRPDRAGALIGLLAACAAVLPRASAQEQTPLTPPHYDEPEQNAFDDYVRAGDLLPEWMRDRVGEAYSADRYQPQDVRDILDSCHEARAALREGLPTRCLIPAGMDFSTPLPYLAKFRDLARLLSVEGRNHEWQGEWDEAFGSYLDGLKLAQDTARRGALIHKLVNIACEKMLLKEVRACVTEGKPDEPTLARLAGRLAELKATEVPMSETLLWEFSYMRGAVEDVMANADKYREADAGLNVDDILQADLDESMGNVEAYFREAVARCGEPYPAYVGRPIDVPDDPISRILLPALGKAIEKGVQAEAEFIATEAVVALERYRLKHGQYPEELAQLVPGVLPDVPTDLFDDQPLKYARDGDRYFLYSVGPDATDDGGLVAPPGAEGEPAADIAFP
jgi:hypothetical protein